jgi:hypothetical protein
MARKLTVYPTGETADYGLFHTIYRHHSKLPESGG